MSDSERRTVRPYLGVSRCQDAFDRISLQVGGESYDSGATARIPERSFREAEISIGFAETKDGFADFAKTLELTASQLEIPAECLEVVAVATTPFLRLAEVVCSYPLSEIRARAPKEVIAVATHRPAVMSAVFHGFTLTVYFCLAKAIPRRPLRPSRKGTWLARASFVVGTDLGDSGFQIEPLTATIRERYGLDKGVIRYVELEDPTNPATNDEDVTLYVDETLLDQLSATPDTPGALVMQRQLGLDVAAAIVYRSSIELARTEGNPTVSDIEGSILDRILDNATRNERGKVDPEQKEAFFDMAVERPHGFVAEIESWMSSNQPGKRKLSKDMRDLVRGADR